MAYTLITGASGGLGLEFAFLAAKSGKNLVLIARDEPKMREYEAQLAAFGVNVVIFRKDLTAENAVSELCDALEAEKIEVDELINNAGVGYFAEYVQSDWARQKNMAKLNVLALMELTYRIGGRMRQRGQGRILNIASVAAFGPGPYMSVYYASKSFVLSFSEAVGEELRPCGVTVTALCLGPTATGFEHAASLEGGNMFKLFKPATPKKAAAAGYSAMLRGKAVRLYGMPTKLMSVGARLAPRWFIRKFAKKVNGIPKA